MLHAPSSVQLSFFIRHCYYVLWQSETISPFEDFLWNVVPALNGQPNSVSFQSTNYPTYFLTLSNATGILSASFVRTVLFNRAHTADAAPGRLGIVPQVATSTYNDASSFQVCSLSVCLG